MQSSLSSRMVLVFLLGGYYIPHFSPKKTTHSAAVPEVAKDVTLLPEGSETDHDLQALRCQQMWPGKSMEILRIS